ncbi:MAG TPA: hypothetical protein VKQ36_01980, partial [Ktedonobacterales bacterium]|nr:hypothetical protein [Ktedonobacterales bacterium]
MSEQSYTARRAATMAKRKAKSKVGTAAQAEVADQGRDEQASTITIDTALAEEIPTEPDEIVAAFHAPQPNLLFDDVYGEADEFDDDA